MVSSNLNSKQLRLHSVRPREQCKKEKGSGNSSLFWAKCKIHHPYVCIGIKEGPSQYMKVTITIRMYLVLKYIYLISRNYRNK